MEQRLRYRDTMEQQRVDIADLRSLIENRVSVTSLLKRLGAQIAGWDK